MTNGYPNILAQVRRREVTLLDLIKLNQLLDAQAAAEDAASKQGKS